MVNAFLRSTLDWNRLLYVKEIVPRVITLIVLESHKVSLAVNNILWMCDGCLDVFYKKRSGMQTDKLILNSSSRFESELADIKSQIHDIVRTLTYYIAVVS